MGGDHGPSVTIPAAMTCLRADPDLRVVLVGLPSAFGDSVLASLGEFGERAQVRHASEVVAMDESPVVAMRAKKDSSMRVAIDLVKEGSAQAVVSAGNTGALMAMARFILRERITRAADLHEFTGSGYRFRPELSSEWSWVFARPAA